MPLWIIAALARDGAIGHAGGLPWGFLPRDMRWFKALTTARYPFLMAQKIMEETRYDLDAPISTNVVISGRRTAKGLIEPLVGRHHVVVTRHPDASNAHATYVKTFASALNFAREVETPNVFAIGGTRIFAEALCLPWLQGMFLTEIDADFPEADTWFPGGTPRGTWDNTALKDFGQSGLTDFFERVMVGPWALGRAFRYRLAAWERTGGNTWVRRNETKANA